MIVVYLFGGSYGHIAINFTGLHFCVSWTGTRDPIITDAPILSKCELESGKFTKKVEIPTIEDGNQVNDKFTCLCEKDALNYLNLLRKKYPTTHSLINGYDPISFNCADVTLQLLFAANSKKFVETNRLKDWFRSPITTPAYAFEHAVNVENAMLQKAKHFGIELHYGTDNMQWDE